MTLFLVSNENGKTWKVVLPSSLLKITTFVAAILILAFVAGFVDYFGLMMQAMENKKLTAENAQLNKQLQLIETKVSSLENSLERVKIFTTKLKLITNTDAEDRVMKLTMGVKPAPGQQIEEYEPMDQRPPPEALAAEDQNFADTKPVSEQKNEVVVQPSDKDYVSLVVRIDKAVRETQLKEQGVIELWESLSERQRDRKSVV